MDTEHTTEEAVRLVETLLGRRPSPKALREIMGRSFNESVAYIITSQEYAKSVVEPLVAGQDPLHAAQRRIFRSSDAEWLVAKIGLDDPMARSSTRRGNWASFFSEFLMSQKLGEIVDAAFPRRGQAGRAESFARFRRQLEAASGASDPAPVPARPPVAEPRKAAAPPAPATPPAPVPAPAAAVSPAAEAPNTPDPARAKAPGWQQSLAAHQAGIGAAREQVLQLEKLILPHLSRPARTADDPRDAAAEAAALAARIGTAITDTKHRLNKARHGLKALAAADELAPWKAQIRARLEGLAAMAPRTPYYRILAEAVQGTVSHDALFAVRATLDAIDTRRQGQVPYAADTLVSIVMPAHDRQDLIRDAIDSVLAQSHGNFELLICDDASTDDTVRTVRAVKDRRIRLFEHGTRSGAAAARNTCLKAARGTVIAYLDSDNIWHPRFLEIMLEEMAAWSGNPAAYAGYFDLVQKAGGASRIARADVRLFHLEDQLDTPFVDLNSLVHSVTLYRTFGGFDERLARRQDYDLISRYCWAREPRSVPAVLNLYRRIEGIEQITRVQKNNADAPAIITGKLRSCYETGLRATLPDWVKKVTVISWDLSRNHFAKPYCVADALSREVEVELVSFRFFDEAIFQPLADAKPRFERKYFEGGDFPGFLPTFARAMESITGDIIYAVKPRLTSFGLALLANYHTGKPVMLENNDLETVVNSAKATDVHARHGLDAVFARMDEALVPHGQVWSQVLDPLVGRLPVTYTHNINLNRHYGNRCLYMRNIKDETLYDPGRYDRAAVRAELGLKPDDRVILFGGLVRKHKGIFEFTELLRQLDDPRYKLLVVGSRDTPDLKKLTQQTHGGNVILLGPQPPERMAALNLASDIVLLWLDPDVPAGQYQSPYKMSDALAMGPAIIASPTSDLADFARRELIWNVPFGDRDALVGKIRAIFDDEAELLRRRERARRFFLREFSYNSVLPAFALGAHGCRPDEVYPVSAEFAEFFSRFAGKAGAR